MKTLYIECNMGAAGDMLMAALLEIAPDPEGFLAAMNALDNGIEVARQSAVKCGITGTQMAVRVRGEEEESLDMPLEEAAGHGGHGHVEHEQHHDHGHSHTAAGAGGAHQHGDGQAHGGHPHGHHGGEDAAHAHGHAHSHSHRGLADIEALVRGFAVSEAVKQNVLAVYGLIAEAEAAAHGRPAEQVHFHEVGSLDAVADVTGVCLLLEQLAPEAVVVSPIHVGSGQVRCAHGILPVPAPATAHILRGVPSYGGSLRGELCTPTGAALLKHFATGFGSQPAMAVEKIGYGMGKKDFEVANCVRVFLGESIDIAANSGAIGQAAPAATEGTETITELACNLDDITGEALAYAQEQLLRNGALDVYTLPLQMKKGRPGHMLCCLCHPADAEALTGLMLRHTTTLGVRSRSWQRTVLARHSRRVETQWGPVRVKTAESCGGTAGEGVCKAKPEYEDLAAIATAQGLPLAQVYAEVARLLEK